MNLQLQKMRKKAGYKKQSDAAKALGVPERRYSSWEREEAMISLEQAFNCARVFNCSIDEIAGYTPVNQNLNAREQELIDCFRASTMERQNRLIDTAKDSAVMSKDAAKRDEFSSSQVSA